MAVGVAGSGLALADAMRGETFVRLLTIEIFSSALGLFGIIVGLIMATNATFPTKLCSKINNGNC